LSLESQKTNGHEKQMLMKDKLISTIDRYRTCPEFLTINLVDVNQRGNFGDSVLHVAAGRQAIEDMEVLVACGAQINAQGDIGNTPLHQAASGGLVESVRQLLRLGADKTIKNEDGQTALDLAELMGRDDVVKMLKAKIG
jgi:ankyrin repeat protein